jgi:hypothetical protein
MASTFWPLICGEWRRIVANKRLGDGGSQIMWIRFTLIFVQRSTFKLMLYQPNSSARIVLRFRT